MNPSEKVRSSDQLWSDQVGLINAIDDIDPLRPGKFWDDYTPGGHPVVYEFNGGRNRFVRPLNPYQ
jgi:hypothetical protein